MEIEVVWHTVIGDPMSIMGYHYITMHIVAYAAQHWQIVAAACLILAVVFWAEHDKSHMLIAENSPKLRAVPMQAES